MRAALKRSEAGFTLIELLVCLVIISLMTAAVVLTLGGEDDPAELASEQFLVRVNNAAERSVITGVPAALGVSKTGYALFNFANGEWTITGEDDFPDDVRVSFTKDKTQIKLPDEPTPIAVFEPTGLGPDFALVMQSPARRFEMVTHGNGRVTRVEP